MDDGSTRTRSTPSAGAFPIRRGDAPLRLFPVQRPGRALLADGYYHDSRPTVAVLGKDA